MARLGTKPRDYLYSSEVAASVGVPLSTLRNWTTGRKCPLPPDEEGYLHLGRRWYPEHVRVLVEWMRERGVECAGMERGIGFLVSYTGRGRKLTVRATEEQLKELAWAVQESICSGEGQIENITIVRQ